MFIALKNVQQLFAHIPSTLLQHNENYCLCGCLLLSKAYAPYSEHILYITDTLPPPDLVAASPNIHILLCLEHIDQMSPSTSLGYPQSLHLLLLETSDIKQVFQAVYNYFEERNAIGEFSDSLLEILFYEGGIQAMVDKTFLAFQNPICVFDAGFRLIAANWKEMRKTESGRKIIENEGFTKDEFEIINRFEHIHERVKKSETAIEVFHPELGYPQLLLSINTKRDFGHIVISGINRPFQELDKKLLILLQKAVDQQMKKDEFIRNNKGFHHEYFLRDLLDGKIATQKRHLKRLNYVSAEFSGNLYCLVIETARSSSTLNTMHIRSQFETYFPSCKTLMYHGEIIVLLILPQSCLLSTSELQAAAKICIDYGIYAGISNCFQNIIELSGYHKQALRAIELGIGNHNEPSLFVYEHYFLEHVANIFMQKESSSTFCSSKLKILLAYDQENGTNLAETLYLYLIHERNLVAAAAAMDLHRNTFTYRMKKISSIIAIDFDSYAERQYIILSYELYRTQNYERS